MFRSILLPTLIACFVAVPMLYQKSTSVNLDPQIQSVNRDVDYYVSNPVQTFPPQALTPSPNPNRPFAATALTHPPVSAIPASTMRSISKAPSSNLAIQIPIQPAASASARTFQPNSGNAQFTPVSNLNIAQPPAVNFSQLKPDFGAAETYTFRGDANGPDLSVGPMQFAPVSNFQEVFRFDVSPVWVKQRWERLTAIPAEGGLHGLRTALVTGTNSWDLNGSLTYFFDVNHRTQRITFRGWVGDPSRLINLATQHFGLKPQPTHWAGLYVANFGGTQTAGLLMKDPDTIDSRNQVQRTAVIMELNQPAGDFKLSTEFLGFMKPAMPSD